MRNDDEPKISGVDIAEALFAIFEGNIPDEMTDEVCDKLATYLNDEA